MAKDFFKVVKIKEFKDPWAQQTTIIRDKRKVQTTTMPKAVVVNRNCKSHWTKLGKLNKISGINQVKYPVGYCTIACKLSLLREVIKYKWDNFWKFLK